MALTVVVAVEMGKGVMKMLTDAITATKHVTQRIPRLIMLKKRAILGLSCSNRQGRCAEAPAASSRR